MRKRDQVMRYRMVTDRESMVKAAAKAAAILRLLEAAEDLKSLYSESNFEEPEDYECIEEDGPDEPEGSAGMGAGGYDNGYDGSCNSNDARDPFYGSRNSSDFDKCEYFDAFVSPEGGTTLRETAKELEVPEKMFISILIEKQLLYRDKNNRLLPYAEYCKNGFFIVRDYYLHSGEPRQYPLVTAKGKFYLRLMFESEVKEGRY